MNDNPILSPGEKLEQSRDPIRKREGAGEKSTPTEPGLYGARVISRSSPAAAVAETLGTEIVVLVTYEDGSKELVAFLHGCDYGWGLDDLTDWTRLTILRDETVRGK